MVGLTVLGSSAGCLGNDVPAPVSLDDEQSCDQCGMIIEAHPGTVGQTFFDEGPTDRDGPARFCSGVCTYTYTLDREDEGWNTIVVYLTDYSAVEYELSTEDGQTFISAHLDADDFADASDLTLVVRSDVLGAMGADLVPFSDADEAAAFVDDHGGDLVSHDDVTRELLAAL